MRIIRTERRIPEFTVVGDRLVTVRDQLLQHILPMWLGCGCERCQATRAANVLAPMEEPMEEKDNVDDD